MARWLLRAVLVLGSLFLGAWAVIFAHWMQMDLARPEKHTRIVYRFDGGLDAHALGRAVDVLRQRLASRSASEISVERRGEKEIVVEFRPTAQDESGRSDDIATFLARRGDMSFLVEARPEDVEKLGSTITKEREKIDLWRSAHAESPIDVFEALAPESGGPVHGLRWRPHYGKFAVPASQRLLIPLLTLKPEWSFAASDLATVSESSDGNGNPAVGFELKPERAPAFGDFTGSIIDRGLAIVIDGEIVTLARVKSRLPGGGIIEGGGGGFTMTEVRDLVVILSAGELPSKPVLVSTEQVTADRSSRWLVLAVNAVGSAVAAIALIVILVRSFRAPNIAPGDSGSGDASTSESEP